MMFESLRKKFFADPPEPDKYKVLEYEKKLYELEDEKRMREFDEAVRQMMQHSGYANQTQNQLSASTYNQMSSALVSPSQQQYDYWKGIMGVGLGGPTQVTPEGKIKDKVKKALEHLGVYYTMPVTSGYGNSGVPDILACVEGRFFGIECKAAGGKPTALQTKHLDDIVAAGGASLVIDETNVDNVAALILAKLGELK